MEGSEPLRYQWFRNGVPIERETQSTLRWTPMTPEDSGIYELHVSNPVGAARGPGIRLTLTFPASVRWIPETRELELTHPALTGQRFALQILRPLQAEIWQTLTTNIAGIHGIQHRHPVGETDSGFFRFLLLDTAPQRTAP